MVPCARVLCSQITADELIVQLRALNHYHQLPLVQQFSVLKREVEAFGLLFLRWLLTKAALHRTPMFFALCLGRCCSFMENTAGAAAGVPAQGSSHRSHESVFFVLVQIVFCSKKNWRESCAALPRPKLAGWEGAISILSRSCDSHWEC